jgi:hypothetical protein
MSEWISVKERLPEFHKRVLVVAHPNLVVIAERGTLLKDVEWHWNAEGGSMFLHDACTHWMPLPEPPAPGLTVEEALKLALSILSDAEQSCRGTRLVPIERWNPWFERYHSVAHRLREALERAGKPTVTYAPSGSVTITVPQEEA